MPTMDTNYRADHKAVLDDLLLPMPGVTGGKSFGYPSYKFGKKVFCFVVTHGITIKLPEARVKDLVAAHPNNMQVFSPTEGMLWNGWVLIDHEKSEDLQQHQGLFEESVSYVSAG